MGKIIDILEAERKRPTAQDWDVVHMYKTGQFYTAYDWSAWIISVISYTDAVRMQTKDRHPLAVTRIKIATSEQNVKTIDLRDIGHAEASINSYLGVLSHSSSYNIRHHLFEEIDGDIIKAA